MLLSVFFFRNSLQFKKVSLPLQPQTRNNGAIAQLVAFESRAVGEAFKGLESKGLKILVSPVRFLVAPL